MELPEFIEEVTGKTLTNDQRQILIIGAGHTPTGRSLRMRDHLVALGMAVHYRALDEMKQKETPTLILIDDFAEMELRMMNAVYTGYSHPEMFQLDVPADKRKGPKGPRKRWGNL